MKTGIVDTAYMYLGSHAAAFARMKQHGYDCTDYQYLVDTENEVFSQDTAGFERTLLGVRRDADNAGIEIYQGKVVFVLSLFISVTPASFFN